MYLQANADVFEARFKPQQLPSAERAFHSRPIIFEHREVSLDLNI